MNLFVYANEAVYLKCILSALEDVFVAKFLVLTFSAGVLERDILVFVFARIVLAAAFGRLNP